MSRTHKHKRPQPFSRGDALEVINARFVGTSSQRGDITDTFKSTTPFRRPLCDGKPQPGQQRSVSVSRLRAAAMMHTPVQFVELPPIDAPKHQSSGNVPDTDLGRIADIRHEISTNVNNVLEQLRYGGGVVREY